MTLLSSAAPVEEFSRQHDEGALPREAVYYRQLIPLTQPAPGQQYGFSVELDACTGCKACVTACHSLNGLDEGESWRRVTIEPDTRQTITSACHHCVEPACMKGCPVDAYEKDPLTGIVSHLDDQCIGCSYCTLTCPYDVPVFNKARGIVRKCDMCKGRLAEGEAPACVQACPNGAISVTLIEVNHVAPVMTQPSTWYRSTRHGTVEVPPVPKPSPAANHTPLAVMLVLTQLAVGAFLADTQPWVAVATGVLALAASVFHLGRPLYAWRAVIGLSHSWLSREVVAFGAFTALAVAYAVRPSPVLWWAAGAAGLGGVVCSMMIYIVTGRWRPRRVVADFVRTTALGALAMLLFPPLLAVVLWAELRDRLRFFHLHQ